MPPRDLRPLPIYHPAMLLRSALLVLLCLNAPAFAAGDRGPIRATTNARPAKGAPAEVVLEPTPLDLDRGDYVHEKTGLHFPEAVGSFERIAGYRYDPDGQNVSITYRWNHSRTPLLVSIYLYPGPSATSLGTTPDDIDQNKARVLASLVDEITQGVKQSAPAAKLLEAKDASLVRGANTYAGKRWVFRLPPGPAEPGPAAVSHVYLFPFYQDQWVVKYRIAHPEGPEHPKKIADVLAKLPSEGIMPRAAVQ